MKKTKVKFQGVPLLQTGHLVSSPKETKYDQVTTHKNVSDRRAVMPRTFGQAQANEVICDTTIDTLTSPVIPKGNPRPRALNDEGNCKSKKPKALSSDSPVEDGKRSSLQRDPLGAPLLIYRTPRKKVCKGSEKNTAERKCPKRKELEAGSNGTSSPIVENRHANYRMRKGSISIATGRFQRKDVQDSASKGKELILPSGHSLYSLKTSLVLMC